MNGTELGERLKSLIEFEDLEYTDVEAFCISAWLNRNKAFAYKYWEYETPNLQKLVETLERKIKEDNYDDEAVKIARRLLDTEQSYYLYRLNDKTSEFKKSVQREILKYRVTARALKLTQQFLQLVVIIGAASVPLILSYPSLPREISFSISLVVAASAALLNFYKFQDHINFQHTSAEKMQLEYNHYLTDRGIYKGLGLGEALDRFMDEIDKLRQETNELSLSQEKAAQDQKQDQIQKMSKSTPEIHHTRDAQ